MTTKKAKRAKKQILIIEDDAAIAEVLAYNLVREGYEVSASADGGEGLRLARKLVPDLVVLDLMLPGVNGIDVCRDLRADPATKHLAILMLTARSEEVDQIVGFTVGADDYVTKPFSLKVLLQRVRALLQRSKRTAESFDALELHGITLDRMAHQALFRGEVLLLTPTEYRLLETMMRQPGRAFTRSDLVESAIGDETIVLERTIDVHIRSLRQKLGPRAAVIETVRGVGYRFARELAPGGSEGTHLADAARRV
jgi:two-component system phosphate regulon response regulator PhoB